METWPFLILLSHSITIIMAPSPTALQYSINKDWAGAPIKDHSPTNISLKWNEQAKAVEVHIQAPFFGDEPPKGQGGIFPGLWHYELVELFFSNDNDHYLEVELSPHGHWLILLFTSFRQSINQGDSICLPLMNTSINVNSATNTKEWTCTAHIPLAYFPPHVTKFNAYAMHGPDNTDQRHMEALYPVKDGDAPADFHDLKKFGPIDFTQVVPNNLNDQIYTQSEYGDMWRGEGGSALTTVTQGN